jgi:hypothetical protein
VRSPSQPPGRHHHGWTGIRRAICISGPYDIVDAADHFVSRGLSRRAIGVLFEHDLEAHSPRRVLAHSTGLSHLLKQQRGSRAGRAAEPRAANAREASAGADAAHKLPPSASAPDLRPRSRRGSRQALLRLSSAQAQLPASDSDGSDGGGVAPAGDEEAPPTQQQQQQQGRQYDECAWPWPPLDASVLPPVSLFHGDADTAVGHWSSADFAAVLEAAGVPVSLRVYAGKSHTDPILEDPMGGCDELLADVLACIYEDVSGDAAAEEAQEREERARREPSTAGVGAAGGAALLMNCAEVLGPQGGAAAMPVPQPAACHTDACAAVIGRSIGLAGAVAGEPSAPGCSPPAAAPSGTAPGLVEARAAWMATPALVPRVLIKAARYVNPF